jgi:hypothetical protein
MQAEEGTRKYGMQNERSTEAATTSNHDDVGGHPSIRNAQKRSEPNDGFTHASPRTLLDQQRPQWSTHRLESCNRSQTAFSRQAVGGILKQSGTCTALYAFLRQIAPGLFCDLSLGLASCARLDTGLFSGEEAAYSFTCCTNMRTYATVTGTRGVASHNTNCTYHKLNVLR